MKNDNSTKQSNASKPMLAVVFPLEAECHCGSLADKYTSRKYKNSFGFDYFRVFYRCRNCQSRIHNDFIPEIDKLETFDVVDFMRNNS